MKEAETMNPVHIEKEEPQDIDDLIFFWDSETHIYSER